MEKKRKRRGRHNRLLKTVTLLKLRLASTHRLRTKQFLKRKLKKEQDRSPQLK